MNCPIALYKRSKTAALQENGLQYTYLWLGKDNNIYILYSTKLTPNLLS